MTHGDVWNYLIIYLYQHSHETYVFSRMGIKNLYKFLKDHYPFVFQNVKVSEFSGKFVASDISGKIYAMMWGAQKKQVEKMKDGDLDIDREKVKKEWMRMMMRIPHELLSSGITPVFVFDGEPIPEKVNLELAKRKIEKEKKKQGLDEARAKLYIDPTNQQAMQDLRKYLANDINFAEEDIEGLFMQYTRCGFCCIRAEDDAEKLCAALCIQGLVDAVMSDDSDLLAFGCPTIIRGISDTPLVEEGEDGILRSYKSFEVVRLSNVLKELNVTYNMFLDYCILCGNDYNINIPQIGSMRAFGLILQTGRIENIYTHNTQCLNYVRSREIFSYSPAYYNVFPINPSMTRNTDYDKYFTPLLEILPSPVSSRILDLPTYHDYDIVLIYE